MDPIFAIALEYGPIGLLAYLLLCARTLEARVKRLEDAASQRKSAVYTGDREADDE